MKTLIDHYNIYTGNNGGTLAQISQTQPGVRSVDLFSLSLKNRNQQLFVQAVGKPSLANRVPAPVSYTPACGTGK